MKQVDKGAYEFRHYLHLDRWQSYYYQLQTVFDLGRSSVLEVGVGDKVLAEYLKNNTNIKYTGVDVAEDLHPDVVASVEKLPFPDGSFDLVCAFEVLEHLPFEAFVPALLEMSRVGKGLLVISLPHFGPSLKFSFKLPFCGEVSWAFKIPWPRRHVWNGQHYWEIGKKGYSISKIRSLIGRHFKIKRDFIPFGNQYHHFFVLEKHDHA